MSGECWGGMRSGDKHCEDDSGEEISVHEVALGGNDANCVLETALKELDESVELSSLERLEHCLDRRFAFLNDPYAAVNTV